MIKALVIVLVLAHGAVHGIVFGLPLIPKAKDDMAPFNPSDSWLVGERRTVAFALALVVAAAFLVAAGGYAADVSWWASAMIGACALSLLLLTVFASAYFIVGAAISVALASWAWLA